MREKRLVLFLIMIALGLVFGLVYGWVINPVKYAETSPNLLRADYQADYVLMVAEIYQSDHNIEQAARRLTVLGDLSPARAAADALLTANELEYADSDLDRISQLSQALQKSPTPTSGGSDE